MDGLPLPKTAHLPPGFFSNGPVVTGTTFVCGTARERKRDLRHVREREREREIISIKNGSRARRVPEICSQKGGRIVPSTLWWTDTQGLLSGHRKGHSASSSVPSPGRSLQYSIGARQLGEEGRDPRVPLRRGEASLDSRQDWPIPSNWAKWSVHSFGRAEGLRPELTDWDCASKLCIVGSTSVALMEACL